ncbi:MAG: nucleoside triphosphate pyrophosphohydrolase [Chloroflexota bacterium]|nr:nucleoside triphosphate pyrophosphohydrolase [Chloroflexota bacterium]
MEMAEGELRTFEGLRGIIARLRGPDGCPWDQVQTHASLKPYLLEEAYEALAALDEGDADKLCDELGDLLLEMLLHVQIAEEATEFALGDVIYGIATKLVRRHPHVFGDARVDSPEEVMVRWEALKRQERGEGGSALADMPQAMPALAYAQRVLDRAARVGFEWPRTEDVLAKLAEELKELAQAEDAAQRREELGDVLFLLVNLARYLEIDAEEALRQANRKFCQRFTTMEALAQERGRSLADLLLAEQEALWEAAKERLRP